MSNLSYLPEKEWGIRWLWLTVFLKSAVTACSTTVLSWMLDDMQEQQQQKKELNDVIFSDLSTRILFLKQNFTCLICACWNVMEQVKLTEMVA